MDFRQQFEALVVMDDPAMPQGPARLLDFGQLIGIGGRSRRRTDWGRGRPQHRIGLRCVK
jgi:hypothetical protein